MGYTSSSSRACICVDTLQPLASRNLKPEEYVAFGLLVLGGTLFAIRLGKGIHISLAFYRMILSSFLLAVYSVALKYLFSTQDF